jgi:hypothetical protein
MSASARRAIAVYERTRMHPGALTRSLRLWARHVYGPAGDLAAYRPAICHCAACQDRDIHTHRLRLRLAQLTLPAGVARELTARLAPLDRTWLARTVPRPETAHLARLTVPPALDRDTRQPVPRWDRPDPPVVRLDLPLQSWLSLTVGEGRLPPGTQAFHVTDALGDLLAALAALCGGAPVARVSWDTRPAEYRWLFAVHAGIVRVRVLLLLDRLAGLPDGDGQRVLALEVPLTALAGAVAGAARELLQRVGEQGYRRCWGSPFPVGPLLDLERRLAGRMIIDGFR